MGSLRMAKWLAAFVQFFVAAGMTWSQSYPAGRDARLGPMLDQGLVRYETASLALQLVRSSGTVARLEARNSEIKGASAFDFVPSELLAARSTDGYYQLGDIDLRLREVGTAEWRGYSTTLERHPVQELPAERGELLRSNLKPTLAADFPLELTRTWTVVAGNLTMRFTLRNPGPRAVEIGSLGIPLIFDNIMSGKSLDEAHALCSFSDPSIALDAGYVQVTRLNGHGPALVVIPDGETPFEAYRPIPGVEAPDRSPRLFEDLTPRGTTFEGFYEWMAASAAYQQNEWKQAEPWNPPTSIVLAPGQTRTVGLRFLVADSIRSIEKTLASNRRPVAVGIPGYILPQDIHANLYLRYPEPVKKIEVNPAGAIEVSKSGTTRHGWLHYDVHGKLWGRARLTITYSDGLVQTVQYRVMKPERETVDDMGTFLFTRQWFDAKDDPFHRSPSVMSYDHQAGAIVTQDHRVWIAGLGDEGGSGSWLAAAMKEYERPDKRQVGQLEDFVDKVLWGGLQQKEGPQQYGVRKSLFYYQPDEFPAGFYRKDQDWSTWESWSKHSSESLNRSYDYPHVVAAYWVLYRLARDHQGLVTHHDWRWYLTQAYETTMAMTRFAPVLSQFGQMEGDIFLSVLEDLNREGMTEEATQVEAAMRSRTTVWQKLAYPFGSEMPWDSTGQEEVYAWTRFFGLNDKAQITLDAIIGYMPAIPSWGYNGSARRYWDFLYGGKYERLERQLHHYGSGLNAIPVLDAYRRDPGDLYLLRIGYGGTMGSISGIGEDGFASAAFHSDPQIMAFDPYSGDYGSNFFGHVWTTGTYLAKDDEFGWLAFGGNLTELGDSLTLEPRDSLRQRVYLAPLGLWLTLDCGQFARVTFNESTHSVQLEFERSDAFTPNALLRIEQSAKVDGVGTIEPREPLKRLRGAYVIPLGSAPVKLDLIQTSTGR